MGVDMWPDVMHTSGYTCGSKLELRAGVSTRSRLSGRSREAETCVTEPPIHVKILPSVLADKLMKCVSPHLFPVVGHRPHARLCAPERSASGSRTTRVEVCAALLTNGVEFEGMRIAALTGHQVMAHHESRAETTGNSKAGGPTAFMEGRVVHACQITSWRWDEHQHGTQLVGRGGIRVTCSELLTGMRPLVKNLEKILADFGGSALVFSITLNHGALRTLVCDGEEIALLDGELWVGQKVYHDARKLLRLRRTQTAETANGGGRDIRSRGGFALDSDPTSASGLATKCHGWAAMAAIHWVAREKNGILATCATDFEGFWQGNSAIAATKPLDPDQFQKCDPISAMYATGQF
ncbi:hypothetical protein DFH08DRAFT_801750 [Mycena albidolilacea]|uniref:Uncharacterized protein n=1 Tax=Mycena albidolilacea TaxID=1033008 RepID=A0AAD7AFY7_9AGAR|nr:hypothetical protein DFH08DRAFT_801750 [Mycena albidolilacea]